MAPVHAPARDVVTDDARCAPGRRERQDGDESASLRVGIDLVTVSDVARSVGRFGDHYVHRIFTPHEVECCRCGSRAPGIPRSYSYQSLAARFAAKEAVVKVLRPVGPRPEWRDIEVVRAPDGWTGIRLSGQAATLAAEAGIDQLAVSLTHEGCTAAAVVIGVCRGLDSPVPHGPPAGGPPDPTVPGPMTTATSPTAPGPTTPDPRAPDPTYERAEE